MVSIGTLIGIATAGAIGIAGYVVYSNRNELGAALSRGIENTLTNPVSDWANNLFADSESSADNSETPTPTDAEGYTRPPAITPTAPPMRVNYYSPYVPNRNNDYVAGSNEPADERTWEPEYTPPPEQDFKPRRTDQYYYADYEDSTRGAADSQLFIPAEKYDEYVEALSEDEGFKGLTKLGTSSPLGKSGFETFGRSKGLL